MKKVVLCGKSLLMSTIGSSLQDRHEIQVVSVDPNMPDIQRQVEALKPDVVIFYLGAVQQDFPLSILQLPDVLLIGIDPVTHQALVWEGRQTQAVATSDLIKLIQMDANQD